MKLVEALTNASKIITCLYMTWYSNIKYYSEMATYSKYKAEPFHPIDLESNYREIEN